MRANKKVKVLIVDDSLLFRETLAREINTDFGIEVVGTASNPFEARDLILQLQPDVLTLDVEMPRMSGIDFLKKLMPQYPIPIIVVSSVGENVFNALDAGAVDFVTKPDLSRPGGMRSFCNELKVKIKIASTAKVGLLKSHHAGSVVSNTGADVSKIIAIGASTGGTEAVLDVLENLPKEMPGIVVVQHMPPVFTKMYAERLNNACALEVKEAQDMDEVKPGRVIIAAGEYHLRLIKTATGYSVRSQRGERVSGHCPSVDVLFDSVAEVARENAIGVILTGMGSDGAKGLLKMKENGAYTIGQDEKSSIVYGMPAVAYQLGAVKKQLPLERISQELCDFLSVKA